MSNGDGIIKSSCIPVLLYVITSYYIFIFDSWIPHSQYIPILYPV